MHTKGLRLEFNTDKRTQFLECWTYKRILSILIYKGSEDYIIQYKICDTWPSTRYISAATSAATLPLIKYPPAL